mmetsp:Transcript_42186/g.88547  ORF Transcript_42186/g.88547 Transcript_42186/m.88547 type:complete len:348 (+) Transcript_42186:248-1291(+)
MKNRDLFTFCRAAASLAALASSADAGELTMGDKQARGTSPSNARITTASHHHGINHNLRKRLRKLDTTSDGDHALSRHYILPPQEYYALTDESTTPSPTAPPMTPPTTNGLVRVNPVGQQEEPTGAPSPTNFDRQPNLAPPTTTTLSPTMSPTITPTSEPTKSPLMRWNPYGTAHPTSKTPTVGPTEGPTSGPTSGPTAGPTSIPTAGPTMTELATVANNGSPEYMFPLGRCQGDCDHDNECSGDLICFTRGEKDEGNCMGKVPGCAGQGETNDDYCTIRPSETYLAYVADSDWNAYRFPLGLCEGDCDRNNDSANGFYCFRRNRFTPVPGCQGVGVRGKDYCIPEE